MEHAQKKFEVPWGAISLFLAGAAVGAVAGVLLAPDEGKKTRRRVGEWLKRKELQGREALEERKEQVLHAIEAGKKLAGV